MDIKEFRTPEHAIEPLFYQRWSPRAFTSEEIPDSVLDSCFEAARWAPSSMNSQPWKFIYSKRGSASWPTVLGVLLERSRIWAQHAAAVLIATSNQNLLINGKEVPSPTHAFETGSAWMQFALQAHLLGWQTHGIGSIDRDKARADLGIPENYAIIAGIAIGRIGDKSTLPPNYQSMEFPSTRKSIREFVSEGVY